MTLARRTLPAVVILLALGTPGIQAAPVALQSAPHPPASVGSRPPSAAPDSEKSELLHRLTGLQTQVALLLTGAAGALRHRVEEGPPFQREERVARLDRLDRLLSDPVVEVAEKFSRLIEPTGSNSTSAAPSKPTVPTLPMAKHAWLIS